MTQYYKLYSQRIIRQLQLYLDLLLIWFQLSQTIYEVNRENESLQIILLFILNTLSIKVTFVVERSYDESLYGLIQLVNSDFNPKIAQMSQYQLVFMLRNLKKIVIVTYDQYCINKNSQIIELIKFKHQQRCFKRSECFCSYQIEDDFWKNLIDQKKMMLFLFETLKQFFEQYESIENSKYIVNQQVKFTYCHFLMEICQSKPISYLKMFGQEKLNTYSHFDKMYSNYMKSIFENKFANNNQSFTKGLTLFKFEKQQYEISCSYISSLIQRKNIINILNKDNINLEELYDQTLNFFKQRHKIKKKFQKLDPNFYYDPLVKEIIKGYANYLNNSKYLVDRPIMNQQKQMNYDPSQECFILLDLDKSNFGRIKKVSEKSFEQIFGRKITYGESLNIILPSEFAKAHDSFVLNFLENINSDQNNQAHSRLVLAINDQGFAIPITIKFTIEFNLNTHLSGLIGNIKLADTSYMYLMVNLDTSQFLNFTKDFYDKYFGKLGIKLNQTQNIYMRNILPTYDDIIHTFNYQMEKGKPIHKESIAFFPHSTQNCEFIYNSQQLETCGFKNYQALFKIAECLKIEIKVYQIVREQVRVLIFQFIEIKKIDESEFHMETNKLQDQEQYFEIDRRDSHFYQQPSIQFHTNSGNKYYFENTSFTKYFIINGGKKMSKSHFLIEILVIQIKQLKQKQKNMKVFQSIDNNYNNLNIDLSIQIEQARKEMKQEPQIIHLHQVAQCFEKQVSSIKKRHSLISFQSAELKKLNISSFQKEEYNLLADNASEKNNSFTEIDTTKLCKIKNSLILSPKASLKSIFFEQDRNFDSYITKDMSDINLKNTDYTQKKSDLTSLKNINNSSNKILRQKTFREHIKEQIEKIKRNFNPQQIIEEIEEIQKDQDLKTFNKYIQNPKRKQNNQKLNTKLKNKHHLFLGQILLGFNLISMIAIAAISILYFFELKHLFNDQKQNLQHTSWPLTMRSVTSSLLYYPQNIKIVDKELFAPKQEWIDFQSFCSQRIKDLLQSLKDGLYEIIISDKEEYPYLQEIFSLDDPIEYYEMRDSKSFNNQIEKRQKTSFFQLLQIYSVYLESYTSKLYNVYNEEAFNHLNYPIMRDKFDEIQYIIEKNAHDTLKSIKQKSIQVIFVIAIISTLLLIVSILLNVFIRKRVQKQLAQFATFSPSQLKKMIYHQDNGLTKFINVIKKNNLEDQILKKSVLNGDIDKSLYNETLLQTNSDVITKSKSISNTSRYPLTSLKFLILSFFFSALILTQPIFNSILINGQIKECDINIHLMRNLYDMRGHMASNMYLNTALIYQRLYPENDFYEQDYFDKGLEYMNSINNQKVSNLTEVIIQELDKKRYRQELYDNFLHKLLVGNMCEALNDYPQFMENIQFKFDYTVCSQLRNSILTKGFQVSLTYAINIFSTIQEILKDPNDKKANQAFKEWERDTFKMVEFDLFIEYMLNIIHITKNFILYMGDDYINSMEHIQKYLLIIYCTSLLGIFLLIWKQLKSYLKQISTQSNHLFSFIDKQVLVSNPYINKFFKNN